MRGPEFGGRLERRRPLVLIKERNEKPRGVIGDLEIAPRINSFAMAYRRPSSAPELVDVAKESPATLKLYGVELGKAAFANWRNRRFRFPHREGQGSLA